MKDHKNETIVIAEAHIRYLVAGTLLAICFSVIAGYYWGKKRAYEEFLESCRTHSLSDQVAATLCALYDTAENETVENSADAQEEPAAPGEEATILNGEQKAGQETQYFAELVGFGTLGQAKNYAARLKKRDVKAYVIEHKSRTARGKTRTWYQVITAPMQYDALQALVDRIKIEDHLQGVTVVEFSHKYKERFERALA